MNAYTEALSWASSYCSRAERCDSEVLAKLDKYELDEGQQARLLAELHKEGYIDEKRYARSYAADQFRFARWGRIKIRLMLKQKHVSDEAIREGLAAISETEYRQTLANLLDEKMKNTRAGSDREMAAKLLRFAYGRGFEPDYVRQCIHFPEES